MRKSLKRDVLTYAITEFFIKSHILDLLLPLFKECEKVLSG